MPDAIDPVAPDPTNGAGLALAETTPPAPVTFPRRPRFSLDAPVYVESVVRRVDQLLNDTNRAQWMAQRVARYAKYRGWLEEKSFPWPNCANSHPPLLPMAELRANAGLHNTVMTLRPLLSAKATQRAHVPREEKITQLIDAQMFVDPGPERAERVLSDFISAFTQDGNAVAYTPWVKDEQRITTVEYRPPQPGVLPETVLFEFVSDRFPRGATLVESVVHRYVFEVPDRDGVPQEVEVRAYQDDDGGYEFEVTREAILYDGPVMVNLPITAVLIPTRCENLQPPSAWNPGGAPYVFVKWTYRLAEIKRAWETGQFNALNAEGWAKLRAQAQGGSGAPETDADDELETLKDDLEGRTHEAPAADLPEEEGHLPVEVYLGFDLWGDEPVFTVVQPKARVLLEVRRLREKWPADRAYRPFAEACALPVPGRYYGISLLELGEALYDLIKGTLDQGYDGGTLANLQFFFYSASAKMPTDVIRLAPGEGYPVPGTPRDTVYFPNLPGRDQQWAFQVIGLGFSWFEKLFSIGGIQQGQVPTGKASALRTVGTTAALLQQGDVRADQLLIRLFGGLRQVALNFHRMNRHLLPRGKEVRVVGWDGAAAEGYLQYEPEDVDCEIDFEFRPDFLLSNGPMLAQAIDQLLAKIATPLGFQLGVVEPRRFFELLKDFARALRLDYRRYLKPPDEGADPPILASEAINLCLQGRRPIGPPLEGPEAHLQTLQAFIQSDQFGLLDTPEKVGVFRAHVQLVQRAVQHLQTMQAAAQFQQTMQAGASPMGGVPTTAQEPAPGTGAPGALPVNVGTAEQAG